MAGGKVKLGVRGMMALVASAVALLIILGRGLLELAFDKPVAFVIQYTLLATVLAAAAWYGRPFAISAIVRRRLPWGLIFAILAVASTIISMVQIGSPLSPLYLAFTLFWIGFFSIARRISRTPPRRGLALSLALAPIALVAVAALEQAHAFVLPGSGVFSGVIRPASTTGSKQHYSIALAMLGILNLSAHRHTRLTLNLAGGAAGVVGTIFSFTRIGSAVLALTGLCWVIILLRRHRFGVPVALFSLLVAGAALIAIANVNYDATERALSATDPDSPGNPGRFEAWKRGLDSWMDGPILVGAHTGIVSQLGDKVESQQDSFNAESGVIQQLANFGLLGAISFYAFLVRHVQAIPFDQRLLRALGYGCIMSTMFYMSIETLPFMAILGFLPWIAAGITSDPLRRKEPAPSHKIAPKINWKPGAGSSVNLSNGPGRY